MSILPPRPYAGPARLRYPPHMIAVLLLSAGPWIMGSLGLPISCAVECAGAVLLVLQLDTLGEYHEFVNQAAGQLFFYLLQHRLRRSKDPTWTAQQRHTEGVATAVMVAVICASMCTMARSTAAELAAGAGRDA